MRRTSSTSKRSGKVNQTNKGRWTCRPRLEALENRLAPALINWVNRPTFDAQEAGKLRDTNNQPPNAATAPDHRPGDPPMGNDH